MARLTDKQQGEKDRMAGYYDKWYRYNRPDEGAAYDRGCETAMESGACSDYPIMIGACDLRA